MPTKYVRALVLSFIIIAIIAWTEVPALNSYNLQLSGALILLYFASRYLFREVKPSFFFATIVLVSIVLLLVFSSGGINSPVFFIINFLLFAIALLIAPYQATVASFLLITILLWQNYQNLTSVMIIDLASLILMTPLAVVFSKSYLQALQAEGKISFLKEAIKDEQSDSLLWIATTAKPSLASVLSSLTDIVVYLNTKGQITSVPKQLVDKLKVIQTDLISLYSSTGTLEKSIEESSDKMEL
jgi:signal transduction histidine kinase